MIHALISAFLLIGCSSLKPTSKKQIKGDEQFLFSWSKNLDPKYDNGNRPVTYGAPRIQQDKVFAGSLNGHFYAFSLENGSTLWQKDEKVPLNSIPSFYKTNVIYGSAYGRLFSRKTANGELNYSIDLGAAIESMPYVFGDQVFVHLRNHKIVALDAQTGKIYWSYQRSVPFKMTLQKVSRPLGFENSIIIGFADGYVARIDKMEGLVLWETDLARQGKFVDIDSTPVLFQGKLLVSALESGVKVLDPQTGALLRTIDLLGSHTPLVLGDEAYIGTSEGEIAVLDRSLAIKKKVKITPYALSGVKLWNNRLIASSFGPDFFILDKNSFHKDFSWKLGTEISSIFSDVDAKGEYISFMSSRNRLYTLKQR